MAQIQAKLTSVGITSLYGWRTLKTSGLRNFHEGIDNATGKAYPHSAFATAIVTHAPRTKDWKKGYWVQYGIPGIIEISHHSMTAPSPFQVGQTVRMGDIVGYAGTSALAASGHHIHTSLWLGGKHVDPLAYLKPGQVVTIAYGGNTAAAPTPPTPITNSERDRQARRRRAANAMFDLYWTGPTVGGNKGTGRMIVPHGSFHVPNIQLFGLLERRRDALITGVADAMLDAEHAIIHGFLRACFQSSLAGIELDATKFNVALTEGFQKLGNEILVDVTTGADGDEIDAAELAAAFDLAIPRIVNSMLKQQGEALAAAAR